jgi:very-short-patch-repair endonuclease
VKKAFNFIFIFSLLLLGTSAGYSQNSTEMSKEVRNLLNKKQNYNKLVSSGYTIQLYNGTELEAKKILARFKIEFPETNAKLLYETPDWKVHVGQYKMKLDADRASLLFKEEFNNIIVVPLGK